MTRAAPTDLEAGGSPSQPIAAPQCARWGVVALAAVAIVAVLLPWKEALVAMLALGPVLAIARADLDARVVPDIWVLALAALGLGVAIASPETGWMDAGEALVRATACVAVARVLSRLAGLITDDRRSREALGTGDLAVIGVSALWLPLSGFLLAVLMSSLAAMLVVAARWWRSAEGLYTEVPYASFLALAAYAVGLMTATGWTGLTAGG